MRGASLRLSTFVAVAATLAACSDPPAPDYQAPAGVVPIATDTPTPAPIPSEAEIKARSERWIECAFNKIRELDDGRSDAATVASQLRPLAVAISGLVPVET